METKIKGITIVNAKFFISHTGHLLASEDETRFFPIDGLIAQASALDKEEIDVIKPYQISENGIQTYFTGLCQNAEASNGNNRAENSSNNTSQPVIDYELDETEEIKEFVNDLDKWSKGCFFKFLAIATIIGIIIIALNK